MPIYARLQNTDGDDLIAWLIIFAILIAGVFIGYKIKAHFVKTDQTDHSHLSDLPAVRKWPLYDLCKMNGYTDPYDFTGGKWENYGKWPSESYQEKEIYIGDRREPLPLLCLEKIK